jgi:molybdopterin-guanine dinucleotide biosynthesis protein B
MIPVVLIVGEKASGKTSLMEKLIAELSRRGFRVGAFKHSSHHLDFDREDKDTGRFARAGAHAVAASEASMVAFYRTTEELWDPERLRDRFFEDVDIMLGEGFRHAPLPKIAMLGKGEDVSNIEKHGLLAVVADAPIKSELPRFSMHEISALADVLEKQILLKKEKREVTLYVNGRKITIKPFIKDFFLNTISAMVASLRDTEEASRITITIDLAENK